MNISSQQKIIGDNPIDQSYTLTFHKLESITHIDSILVDIVMQSMQYISICTSYYVSLA